MKRKPNETRVVIVGAGMAGLAAAAYLSKAGFRVQLIEKSKNCGGLLTSFQREGFTFDAGARSIENSGIIRPMLQQLGIELELFKSPVSIGLEDTVINIEAQEDLSKYKELLDKFYPESSEDVQKIITFIEKILKYMAILYGMDNPIYKDLKNDRAFLKQMLPWLGKFLKTVYQINRMQEPVESFLAKMLSNRSLIDIIDQHFFKNTPMFFALGYFFVYLDYFYPKGGTGELPRALEKKITEWGGEILTEIEITEVNAYEQNLKDSQGNTYKYDHLIWAADLKAFYRMITLDGLSEKIKKNIAARKDLIATKRGGDSVFTLFLAVNEPIEKFKPISNGHFFYTPSRKGLGEVHRSELKQLIDNFAALTKEQILSWLEKYSRLTTYEISIPALRDPALAPMGKTGLVLSFLFEYDLVKKIADAGWYDEFRAHVEKQMLETLSNSIFPGLKNKIIFQFSSSPLTIANLVRTSEGGITGWSFESEVPVVHKLLQISQSIKTPIPNVFQAGQWAYSPAGIPIALLTGTLAAQKIMKS